MVEGKSDKLNEHLDRLRDKFHYSVYKCSCGFRAFGAAVSSHELTTGHDMFKEVPVKWDETE